VEVAKNQTSSPYNSLNLNDYKDSNCVYRTIILSGGEGYEEYNKSNPSINLTTSSGNNSVAVNMNTVGLNQGQSQNANSENQLNVNNNVINNGNNSLNLANASASNSAGPLLQSQNSFASSNYASNFDESSAGKDDLINYVITWEL
jgi:hypothetical protein